MKRVKEVQLALAMSLMFGGSVGASVATSGDEVALTASVGVTF